MVLEQELGEEDDGREDDAELANTLVALFTELGIAPKEEKVEKFQRRVVAPSRALSAGQPVGAGA